MPAGAHGSGLSAPGVALPRPARIRSRLRSVPMSGSGPHEVAIRGECPEREVRAVTVVLQIKHPRETWCGEVRISPETIRLLCTQQVFDAAPHSYGARLPAISPRSAHAVWCGVLSVFSFKCCLHAYPSLLSPQPPSGFCLPTSQVTARCTASSSGPMPACPNAASTDHVP